MNPNNPAPILVVAAVIRRDMHYFIARRSPGERFAGQWEFPGGKVDPGETPEAALQRELREELDIEASIGKQLAAIDIPGEKHNLRLLFFEVAIPEDPIRLRNHDASAWATLAELRNYPLIPADREFLEKIGSGPG